MKPCIFCNIPKNEIILENELFIVTYDGYPVTPLHCLIIPKRHCSTYFDLLFDESSRLNSVIHQTKLMLDTKDPTITGYNIGMNCGKDSGQTIDHCHIHLIPRRKGDMEEPRGGVRHVIPSKGAY